MFSQKIVLVTFHRKEINGNSSFERVEGRRWMICCLCKTFSVSHCISPRIVFHHFLYFTKSTEWSFINLSKFNKLSMADPELEAIRNARMKQMQGQQVRRLYTPIAMTHRPHICFLGPERSWRKNGATATDEELGACANPRPERPRST